MSRPLSRRTALRGSLAASLGLVAGASAPARGHAASPVDTALIVQADTLKALRARELQAWADLSDDVKDDGPEMAACSSLTDDVCAAGEVLAGITATTPAGLAMKASAMLALVGYGCWAETEAFREHHLLVASTLRDAAGGQEAMRTLNKMPRSAPADARLDAIAAELVALQAQADRLAPHAEADAYDPYTETVAQMDRLGEEAARLAADTMAGVLAKLRALAVPIIGDEGENAGPGSLLGRSVCRDIGRVVGILQPKTAQVPHG
jgi:hypothetical protein